MKTLIILLAAVLFLLIAPVVAAQATPAPSRAFRPVSLAALEYEEVSFTNEAAGIRLAGMLFVPEGAGPFPAAVVIHGDGTSVRDNGWYLTMTQYLQAHGIAVLLPDKRGSVKSEGDWRSASFEELAGDAVAAVNYLRTQDDVPVSHIGVIGMSQGGQYSPVVPALSDDVSYVVDVVGAAVTLHEQLLYEENHNLREMGFLPGVSNLIAYPAAWSIREVRQTEFWDAVGNFDPLPYWRQVEVPALALYGAEDPNVPAEESAARLNALGKDNITVRVYEGSGHALEDPPGRGDSRFREDALREMREFIAAAGREG